MVPPTSRSKVDPSVCDKVLAQPNGLRGQPPSLLGRGSVCLTPDNYREMLIGMQGKGQTVRLQGQALIGSQRGEECRVGKGLSVERGREAGCSLSAV